MSALTFILCKTDSIVLSSLTQKKALTKREDIA